MQCAQQGACNRIIANHLPRSTAEQGHGVHPLYRYLLYSVLCAVIAKVPIGVSCRPVSDGCFGGLSWGLSLQRSAAYCSLPISDRQVPAGAWLGNFVPPTFGACACACSRALSEQMNHHSEFITLACTCNNASVPSLGAPRQPAAALVRERASA